MHDNDLNHFYNHTVLGSIFNKRVEIAKTAAAAKPEGKLAKLHAMWADAQAGELLPRTFTIELAIAEGVSPSTARTQHLLWYKRCQQAATQEQPPTQ